MTRDLVVDLDSSPKGKWFNKDMRWLLVGGSASALGDQLTLVALPWLVLSITDASWVLGLVIALVGIPKAVLILFGGVLVDRFSPKRVMLISKCVNAVALSVLALFVYFQLLTVLYLCILSFLFGVSEAFSAPARSAILPRIVSQKFFEKANGMFMLVGHVVMIVGPLVAGVFLGLSDSKGESYLFLLFAFDAITYAFSAFTLSLVASPALASVVRSGNMLENLLKGFSIFWSDKALRYITIYVAVCGCIVGGVIQIGLPLLVKNIWGSGGDSYSYLLSLSGFGAVLGVIIAARSPSFLNFPIVSVYLAVYSVIGALIILLGTITTIGGAYPIIFCLSLLGGYVQVRLMSWIQRRVAVALLGRVMSIIMFATVGMVPISATGFGILIDHFSVSNVCLFGGIALLLISTLSAVLRKIVGAQLLHSPSA